MHCAFFGLNHHLSVTTWLLCIGCAAVASSLRVTAVEGRTVLINCFPTTDTTVRDTDSDTDTDTDSTDQASSALYLCKGHSRYTCQDVLRVEGSHVRRADERFLLKPAAGVPLVVLITDAQLSDSGTYWCGLHRSKRFAEYEEIHLYVAPKTDRSDTTPITATPAVAKQQQTTATSSVTTGLPINIILSVSVVAAFVLGVTFLVLHRNLGKHKAVKCLSNAEDNAKNIFPIADYENTAFYAGDNSTKSKTFYHNTNEIEENYLTLITNTIEPDAVYQSLNPNTIQPDSVYQSLNSNRTSTTSVYANC